MLREVYNRMAGSSRRAWLVDMIEKKRRALSESPPRVEDHPSSSDSTVEAPTTPEANEDAIDQFVQTREDLQLLERRLDQCAASSGLDLKISGKDIDTITRRLGVTLTRKAIDQMIWELDEDLDGLIGWDEFQLAYYRRISDSFDVSDEPVAFFHLMEFLIFDDTDKGYFIEDDCMEVLFARNGSDKLESELQFIFGSRLRAAGGDGTLDLRGYLSVMERRDGRRALINF